MMVITFSKRGAELVVHNHGLLPVVCHFEDNFMNTKVYPLYAYGKELLEKHYLRRSISFEYFDSVLSKLNVQLIMRNPL